jgi:L-ascorbate metabolism protein UlaG (beta-lactamase superfamily)
VKNSITIRLLGIGAVSISIKNRNIFFDAFNDHNPAPKLKEDDILLFSHDDGDHFSPKKLLPHVLPENTIIGPPSIAYPLLSSGKISPKQLQVPYPQQIQDPIPVNIDDISFSIFNTEHFDNWKPVHISLLIKYAAKSIYLCGDSYLTPELKKYLTGIDCIIYNLVKDEVVKETMSKRDGLYHHMSELLQVQHEYRPKRIICNHLLNCDWTIDALDLKNLIKQSGTNNIIVPQSENDVVKI